MAARKSEDIEKLRNAFGIAADHVEGETWDSEAQERRRQEREAKRREQEKVRQERKERQEQEAKERERLRCCSKICDLTDRTQPFSLTLHVCVHDAGRSERSVSLRKIVDARKNGHAMRKTIDGSPRRRMRRSRSAAAAGEAEAAAPRTLADAMKAAGVGAERGAVAGPMPSLPRLGQGKAGTEGKRRTPIPAQRVVVKSPPERAVAVVAVPSVLPPLPLPPLLAAAAAAAIRLPAADLPLQHRPVHRLRRIKLPV